MKKLFSYMYLGLLGLVTGMFSIYQVSAVTNQPIQNCFGWDCKVDQVYVPWTDNPQASDGLITVVKNGINRMIGILSLIALILLLWGGVQMVTSAGDQTKYEAWFKILKNAAFGLLMIWVAWFVVSLIFFVINLITT